MITPVVALPAGLRRVLRPTLHREPWRNGLGWTSTVATHEVAGQPAWRVSIAEIEAASPFSRFPGLDRIAVLIAGGPLTLAGAPGCWPLHQPGDEARFAGEADMANTAPVEPALIWNVMSDRTRARADVQRVDDQPVSLPPDGQTLVWVLAGRFEVDSPQLPRGFAIEAGEGLHWAGGRPGPTLLPASTKACLLYTRLWA